MTWGGALKALNEFIDSGRWLKLLFFLGGVMLMTILVKIQRGDNRVDFKEMLLEDGKTSPRRVFVFGAFLAQTWAFVVLANNNSLQEWYFNGYAACWILNGALVKYLELTKQKPPSPTSVTVSAAPGTSVNVGTGQAPDPPV